MRRRLNSEDGFGLIELTIALTVLAIGITSVTSLFVTGHFALRRASQSDTAAVMAQQLLERFRAETWHKIGLSSALVSSTDSVYQSDSAYNATTAVTFDASNDPNLVLDSAYPQEVLDTTHPCSGTDLTAVPIACQPSRAIPDTNQTPTETAPDGQKYRIDTYVNWGCTDGSTPDMSTSPPTCIVGGQTQPFGQVKIVTIVVRDATSSSTLAAAPVYRVTSSFDRLAGGSMPTVTVTPTTPGSTSATTTTVTPTSTPNPPTSISLANGGGSGNAYVNAANATSLTFDVTLPSTSVATDTITLTLSDGDPTHDQTKTASGFAGGGVVHFTGINGQLLNDGTITLTATAANSNGTSAATTSTVTKDTVAPDAPTSVTLANGQGQGSAYVNSVNKSSVSVALGLDLTSVSTDTASVKLSSGTSTTSAATAPGVTGGGTATVTGINASSLPDGSVTASVAITDAAGNTSGTTTASFAKDTVKPALSAIESGNVVSGALHKAEAGDTVTLTFSEAILGSSVPASSDVAISTTSGNNKPVVLEMPNLVASGGFQIGSSGTSYLAKGAGPANFTGSALSQPSSTKVRVTLGVCSGDCGNLLVGNSANVTVTPYSGLTDLAGNPVSSSSLSAALSFF